MATVIEPSTSREDAQQAELLGLRSKYLKNDRILGPAWILLLKLASRASIAQPIEVCDLIASPFVTATTAQNCLDYLLVQGIVRLGPGTGRRFRTVEMTPKTSEQLLALLASTEDGSENPRNTRTHFY